MATEEIEVLELGEDLLDANNVSDRTVILAEIAGEPVFQKRTITYNDKQTGEERSFPKVELKWSYRQIHPEVSSPDRDIYINISRAQAEALEAGKSPSMHAKTDLGRITRQCSDAGLPNPGSSDLVGKVLVLASYTEEFRGRTERKYDVLATVGSAEDFDLERGIAIVQDEALASKQQVSASY